MAKTAAIDDKDAEDEVGGMKEGARYPRSLQPTAAPRLIRLEDGQLNVK